MNSLYELTGQYLELWNAMGDSADDDKDIFLDTLEGIEGEIEIKADGYAKVIAAAKADVDALKKEEQRLADRRRVIENNINRMKESLFTAMKLTGKEKFKTHLFSFGIQKNPASVNIENEAAVPEKYLIAQAPKIDKKSIIADLKAGEVVEGCSLFQGESLRIR